MFIKLQKLSIKMQKIQNSFARSKIFDTYAFTGYSDKRNAYDSVRRPESLRRSQRKPIFDGSNFYSSFTDNNIKRPQTYNQSGHHIQQVIHDDFCGCQHNLDPCRHIQQLVKQLSEKDMREEYLRLQAISAKRNTIQIRRKYFKYLPTKYPQIYHAHLTNILSNLGQELTINQFYALAWIQYHTKLEHLTYFLFSDLKKSLRNKKKFISNLQIQLIKYEVNFPQLLFEANQRRLPFQAFLNDFYQSVGAIIVPLSQYAIFLKLLLKSGSKIKLKLLVLLIVKKKQSLFELIKNYSYSLSSLRQQSRQLAWQLFFDELVQMR